VIIAVTKAGPADQAGLKIGDIIVSVNGDPIANLDELDAAAIRPAGSKLELTVRRNNDPLKIPVVLAARPAEGSQVPPAWELPAPRARTRGGEPAAAGGPPVLGISVLDVTDRTQRRFGTTVHNGAVIIDIQEGTPAARAGLPLGAVIVSLNHASLGEKRIASAAELETALQMLRPGDEIELTYYEGDRVGRKKVRLVPGVPAMPGPPESTAMPAAVDPSEAPPSATEPNALQRLEQSLDDPAAAASLPTPPESAPPPPPPAPSEELPPPAAPSPSSELTELRRQVDTLQRQLDAILQRISILERALNPAPPQPQPPPTPGT
ncbi:MAG: PDZ domain-containing protein, partial [Planctomycetes bacterium]|nr:PDZ domain-containing protein [Planctomycetota bacterium]